MHPLKLWVDPALSRLCEPLSPFLHQKGWALHPHAQTSDAFLSTEKTLAHVDILSLVGVRPLIIYQPRLTLPEFYLEDLNEVSLSVTLQSIQPLCEKLTMLGSPAKDAHFDIFYAGLLFLWSRDRAITPLLDTMLKKGFGYLYFDTVIHTLRPDISLKGIDIFRYLEESSLVESAFFETAHTCPRCESIMLLLRDSCLQCGSPHIDEEVIVHHFSCAFQAAESQYLVINESLLTEYVCPKCKKPLRHFGVDYDKPGVIYHCHQCNHDNSDTEVYLKCMSCSYTGKGEESKKIDIPSFQITNNGRRIILGGDSHVFNIRRFLKDHIRLIPFDTFMLHLQKMSSLREHKGNVIMTITTGGKINEKAHPYAAKLLIEMGKSLSTFIRKSDSVSLYQSNLFVMFTDTHQEAIHDIMEIKKKELKAIFPSDVLNLLTFNIMSGAEFLAQVGGNQ